MTNKFDPFGDFQRQFSIGTKWGNFGLKAGRYLRAQVLRIDIEQEYGPEVADAVEAAVRSGRDPGPIIERAKPLAADIAY